MFIKKDKSSYTSCNYYVPTPEDSYIITDYELEQKVINWFPDIDLVVEDDVVIDVIHTKPPEPTIEERVEKNEADIAYVAMMTDVDIEG